MNGLCQIKTSEGTGRESRRDGALTALGAVFFYGRAAAREGESLHFLVDLLGRVCYHNAAVAVAGRHLARVTLKRREELGVEKSGLGQTELGGDVTSEAEVRVLIDSAGDEAHGLLVFLVVSTEYVRECGCEGRGCLNGREHDLADVVGNAANHALLVRLRVARVVLLAGGNETKGGAGDGGVVDGGGEGGN